MNGNELESLTRDWPGVANSIKWEDDLVFTVAGKMFAVYCLRGPHRERVSFKVDPERFLELTDQPGIVPAAYMARAFWISIAEPDRFARAKMSDFVRHSYDLVRGGLSKKQQAALAAKERPEAPAVSEAVGAVAKVAKSAKPGAAKSAEVEKPRAAQPAKVTKPKAAKPAKKAANAVKSPAKAKKATKARGA